MIRYYNEMTHGSRIRYAEFNRIRHIRPILRPKERILFQLFRTIEAQTPTYPWFRVHCYACIVSQTLVQKPRATWKQNHVRHFDKNKFTVIGVMTYCMFFWQGRWVRESYEICPQFTGPHRREFWTQVSTDWFSDLEPYTHMNGFVLLCWNRLISISACGKISAFLRGSCLPYWCGWL